ncbi:uncharacterized protein Z520_12171 [Fonsecaea multimorphosa CBS 102226]|uniref:Uncharacterized protein n=1 Tax=Fonsecaea multimorphosa CBS 102226 TaxID=1442371 RepID=A0A0D2JG03_9EURO|nr:uncharacterized protein Z520_12171 [Fonsecaea multimorphosa CBS 102226]KIX92087.1 hypothetical protein Z520_12171 [Fonsecaea multimorphosa CBS 102226]
MEDEILHQRSRVSWAYEKVAAILIIILGPFVGLIGGACLPLIWVYFRVEHLIQYLRSPRAAQEKDTIFKMAARSGGGKEIGYCADYLKDEFRD